MSEEKTLRFSLKRKQMSVELEEQDGTVNTYVVRELSGDDRDTFLNLMSGKLDKGPDGQGRGIKNFRGMHSDLLALAVFDQDGKAVSVAKIQSWPTTTQTKLFQLAQKLSGLGEKQEEALEEAKND